MAKRNLKRCSMSFVTREIQIDTKIRHHFIPTTMAIIKKKQTITNMGKDVKKLEPSSHCW